MAAMSGFKRIARDVAALAELQMQLLAIDGKVAASRGIIAVGAVGLGAVIALSSFTALLIAIGVAIHEFAELPLSVGLLISGLVGLVVTIVLCVIAWQACKKAFGAMEESRSELANNIRWVHRMLSSDETDSVVPPVSDINWRAAEPVHRSSNRVF